MIEVQSAAQARATGANLVRGVPNALDYALTDETQQLVVKRVADLQKEPSPSSFEVVEAQQGLPERLFDALAAAKILTAQVAMHFDREWRNKLFEQLDSLHDPNEWELDDEPVRQASFATFLKAMLELRPERRPGLGISHTGQLIGAWTTDRDRLTIEFLTDDRVRWVLVRYVDGEPDRFAGETPVSRLVVGLAPHRPEHWFLR